MEKIKANRATSFGIVAVIYVIATFIGVFVYRTMTLDWWLSLLIADLTATIVVFLFSLMFKNASAYDPYWSLQPLVILVAFAMGRELTLLGILLLIVVPFWAIRLTANWAYTFANLNHQDWRYTMLKEKTGSFYPVVNFVGIHIIPTLVVYACIIPGAYAIYKGISANIWSVVCLCISLGAVVMQGIADIQMHKFRKNRTTSFIRIGLWKYSRHPNYLGEILMWWGVGLSVVCAAPSVWYLVAGAVANTVLFLVVSIPMADKRQASKEGFEEYKKQTRMLLPLKKITLKRKTQSIILNIFCIIAVIAILLFLLLCSVNYSLKICDENFIEEYSNLVSVLCQIVISVACCIVSVLGIAISLQNEKIYGISRRRFDKLRIGVHFSILGIIIWSLVLSVFSIVAYSLDMYLTCVYCLILLIAFCFVACISEIPIMCHRERSILNVVKKKLKMEMATGEDLSLDLKSVIKNIVTEDYSIKKLYCIFKSRRNKKYNKELLIKLLEIHCDYAFELAKLDEGIKDKKAERLVENIKDILSFKEDFDVIQITDNEIWSYQHLITRVLFRTSEIESSRSKTVHLIFDSLPFIDHYKDKEHKRFVMSIIIRMISASLTAEDLSFAYELKRVCSSWQYSINKGGALTTVFALTSAHLEYLCTSARNVTQEYKEQIRKFIEDTSVIEYCKTTSWPVLYSRFLENFSLNAEEFLYYFKLNEDGWDMRIFDSHAHFVIMDEKHAIMWFLANLFSTHSVWTYDYNKLLSINSAFHGTLQYVGDQILNDESTKARMLEFVTFFLKDKNFKSFELDEERNHRFETFVSNLHKKDIDKLIVETESIDTKELAKAYEVAVNDSLEKEWGFSKDFDLNETAPKFLKTMIEVKSFAMNYAEVLSDYLSNQIMFEIERSIPKTEVFYSRLSELKESIVRQKKLYIAEIAKYDIQQLLSESASEDKVEVVPFNSLILGGHYVLCNTPMKFGAEIKVQIENLTKQQASEKAEDYKAQDGRYIYEGAFLSREELEGIIEKQYAILILELKYQVNGEELTVYEINYLDPDETK